MCCEIGRGRIVREGTGRGASYRSARIWASVCVRLIWMAAQGVSVTEADARFGQAAWTAALIRPTGEKTTVRWLPLEQGRAGWFWCNGAALFWRKTDCWTGHLAISARYRGQTAL